nr:MAG TPA: helix-turn-helix protein [Caudoviricetes sp.]
MDRNDITVKDIAKRKIMTAPTYYAKVKNPERFRLDDIWRLDSLLHFTEEEFKAIRERKYR